jgi:MFS transporter, DHA2 family, glioxin efflux transporter
MAVSNDKAIVDVEDADSANHSTLNTLNENDHPENSVQEMSDDEYPKGIKFAILAGASMVSVFLIALDQVKTPPPEVDIEDSLTKRV